MSAARRLTTITLTLLCAGTALLLLDDPGARAAVTHELVKEITEVPAKGPHGEVVEHPGRFGYPGALTLDSGELYVADFAGGYRLDKFDASSGAFLQQFASIPPPYQTAGQNLAVGHSTGETQVYDVANISFPGPEPDEGVLAVYDPAGEIEGYWTGADTPAKGFKCFHCGATPGGVAVDNSANPLTSGHVYVSVPEENVVDIFEPKTKGGERYIGQLTGPEPGVSFHSLFGVAVDQQNSDLLVIDGDGVDVFEPTALEQYVLVRRLTGPPQAPFRHAPASVVVNSANGDVYVLEDEGEGIEQGICQFAGEGAFLGRLTVAGEASPSGESSFNAVAVDPATGYLYAAARVPIIGPEGTGETAGAVQVFGPNIVTPNVTTSAASNVTHAGATLNGTVNPENAGEATCRFEWGTTTEFGKVAPCEPEGVAEGGTSVPVHATIGGLAPDTTYHYRLQATNKADGHTNPGEPSQDGELTTKGPGIDEESVTNVAATSATLDADIDPNDAPTTYYFQYGTSTAYGGETPVAPGASIGSGKGDEKIFQHIQGLRAGTVYHYRAIAVSELKPGEFYVDEGADQTFLTQAVGSEFALPDDRQWEMVTPPDKHGAKIQNNGQDPLQASISGNALTYPTDVPDEASPQGYSGQAQSLSLRGPEGWISRDISPPLPGEAGPVISEGQEYRYFSEDLSLSLVHPFAGFNPSLSLEASEQTAYLRTDYLNDNVDQPCLPASMGCYRPLVTGKPGYANVPAGTVFGEEEPGEQSECAGAAELGTTLCGPEVVGATSDLSHILLESGVPLTVGGGHLYEWADGKLTNIGDAKTEGQRLSPRHQVSADGSRVIFDVEHHTGLAMQDLEVDETVRLDAVQGGKGIGRAEPLFQAASSDDSKIFFTDPQQLTANAHTTGEADLYECEIMKEAGKLACDLSNLTPGAVGESGVQGVMGASEDGSYVYFVTSLAVAPGALDGNCPGGAHSGRCNLYVRHDGVTKLVAVLSPMDEPDWAPSLENQTARVSPNGEWLAFMSEQDLTGYDTRDAITDIPDEEVYLYNANKDTLVCASCDPTGARPVGVENLPGEVHHLDESDMWEKGDPYAANIPGWNNYRASGPSYQTRYLSNDGRLYFNSDDALVPQDVNGTEDVYEYEPPGVGDCTTASATYSERSSGCIAMISSGISAEESGFVDASEGGGDVFFVTAARLASQDYDTALDIYDARECTATAACYPVPVALPPPCDTGDACKPAPTPQPAIFGSPSSATFSGAGNIVPSAPGTTAKPKGLTRTQKLARALQACRGKRRGKRRSLCERQARARYAGATSGGASNTSKRGGKG